MTVIESVEILDVMSLPVDADHIAGYCIDSPRRSDRATRGQLDIAGWVLGTDHRAVMIECLVGNQIIAQTSVQVHRPDVAAVYPNAPLAERSGFHMALSLLGMPFRKLQVQAVLEDLTRVELAVLRVRRSWHEDDDSEPDFEMSELSLPAGDVDLLTTGWEAYWRDWHRDIVEPLPGLNPQHPGDEWTVENAGDGSSPYGIDAGTARNFDAYIRAHVLDPYLPYRASEGLEIGPGGGRLSALLAPRTEILHLVEPSESMLLYLKKRFLDVSCMRYYFCDGFTLPMLTPMSLDFAISWDVFVHFEPRLIYWYLKQIKGLLRPGGVGIIHYANIATQLGWQRFERYLERNVRDRIDSSAFGVMCPEVMEKFLTQLQFDVITLDTGIIPRDAVAVFRQKL